MSRVGQNLMETPTTPGAEPPVHGAYLLTGRAGSFLYMSPEVIMCQPYNEKVTLSHKLSRLVTLPCSHQK